MDHTGDIVVIVIVVGALAIGLISMAIGQLARFWDWLIDWRPRPITSSRAAVPDRAKSDSSHGSYAAEPRTEPSMGTTFPAVLAYLEQCDDDQLLDILAQIRSGDDYRFVDSRIAKFIPGRTEDRQEQVRAARGEPTPLKSGEYRTPIADRPSKAAYQSN